MMEARLHDGTELVLNARGRDLLKSAIDSARSTGTEP
jgi:hypothetical protein